MAIFTRARKLLSSSLLPFTRFQRCNQTLGERSLQAEIYPEMAPAPNPALQPIDKSKWKKIHGSKVGISASMISHSSWTVLSILHRGGFEAYLVGGCVRDLLLNRIPKDYDVMTTANLKQIKKNFHRAQIVGKRFPICIVQIKGSIVEVSSFETVATHDQDKEKTLSSLLPNGCNEKDLMRWRNSRCRDFTINSLFFDPFTCNVYDYNDAMSDLKSLTLRTLIPAYLSFQEDCARILRGLRIAARLNLSISRDTEKAMNDLSDSIGGLDKFRLMLEVNYMLSYGAAVPSICLLLRFNLLNILLPFQAAYINAQRSSKNSMMLMKLFFNLDKLVSCGRPTHSILWIGLLMFHLALVNNPQDALVVWTFASVLYHGKWKEGVEFAREHTNLGVQFVPEISGFSETYSDEDLAKEVARFASLVQDSCWALTDSSNLFQLMSRFPCSPCSGLVFVPKSTTKRTAKLFDPIVDNINSFINERGKAKSDSEINYDLLRVGNTSETRYVLGKIILETMKVGPIRDATERAADEKDLQVKASEEILANNQFLVKEGKKRALPFSNPDDKGSMPKKQKSVDRNLNPSVQIIVTNNREVAPKVELNTKMDQQFTDTGKASEYDISSILSNIAEKEIIQERTVVKEEKSKKPKEKKSKKHRIAPDAASKKKQKVFCKEGVKRKTEHKGTGGKNRQG